MSTVLAPSVPLYQQGWCPQVNAPRFGHLSRAPKTPMYQMGLGDAAQLVKATAPIAVVGSSSIATAVGAGAVAGPIGMAAGVVVGLIAGLLAGHEVRKKQATNENSAMNIGVQGYDSDLKQIQQALKSGQISSADALQAVQQTIMPGYWTVVGGQIQPGRNGCNTGASCPPPSPPGVNPCQGNIGAACCVGCFDLLLSVTQPDGVLAAIQGMSTASGGKYTSNITEVYGSKYGGQQRNAYTLDWTPPAASLSPTSGVTALASDVSSALGGGSNSWLLIAAIAAFLVLK